MRDYDFFVIGAGSGGVRAARMAATAGARVGIAENSRLGGTCVNVGCVPKKLMVYASHVSEEIEDAAGYGWQVPRGSFDWATLIANKDKEIARLNDIYRSLLVNAGVDLFEERAELDGPHGVRMASRSVDAERILVATGGWPSMPDIPGIEHAISSNEVFHLGKIPARVAVVGGGYIAVEFAGIFNGLGAEVIELYRGEQILRGFDDDVRNVLAEEIRGRAQRRRAFRPAPHSARPGIPSWSSDWANCSATRRSRRARTYCWRRPSTCTALRRVGATSSATPKIRC